MKNFIQCIFFSANEAEINSPKIHFYRNIPDDREGKISIDIRHKKVFINLTLKMIVSFWEFFFTFLFSISSLKNGKKRWLNEEKLFENNFWWDCAQGKTLIPTVRLICTWQSLNAGQVWIEFERPVVENPFFRYLMVTMTVDWCGCVSNGFNKRLLGYSDWKLNKKVIWCQLKK